MNYFLKALLQKRISLTSTLEKRMKELPGKVEHYHKVEKSTELKEFETLTNLVNSDTFAENAKKAERLKELARTGSVKTYQKLLKDSKLQAYLAWAQNAEEYNKLADAAAVKADAKLKAMKKMDQSKTLKTWNSVQQSAEVAEFLKLQAEVKDYSAEVARQKTLAKDEDILFYQHMDKATVARYEKAQKIFEDNFDLTQIDKNGWKPGFAYPKGFKQVHSYVNEQQSYVGGKNVEVNDSILTIHTLKQANTAPAWDPKKGMVMTDFAYTSDVIYNTQAFEEGTVLQVKARCRGFMNHGIYLRSEKHIPFLSVFNYSEQAAYCGLKTSIQDETYVHEITGLQPIPYTIYTVVWGKDEIIWYVNDLEVHRTKNLIPKGEKMYLHLYSFRFNGKFASEGKLEVDWIRAYKATV